MKTIAIIGAGISGLTTAQLLMDKYDVTIYERDHIAGGLLKCQNINGSLFHTCGGHVFNTKRQDVLDLFWSFFNQEQEFVKSVRNSTVLFSKFNNLLIPYPIENHIYLFPKDIQLNILKDFLELPKLQEDEVKNFENFLKSRFGETLYYLYFQPYNRKVWRREIDRVPLSWLQGKLPMPTVTEILYNNFNHVKEKEFVHSTFWYEKEGGSQYLCNKLAYGLNIIFNYDIKEIRKIGTGWEIDGRYYDIVVFSGNIKRLPYLVKGIDSLEPFYTELSSLEYHGTTSVFCEIDANPYSWIYLPSSLYESHRIICTGNFSKNNNSDEIQRGRVTATVEFTDDITEEQIFENLARMPLNPQYITHVYNKYTYPIQDINTRAMIQDIRKVLSESNLYLIGRFAEWEYYNMDAAIGSAIDTCKIICQEKI